MYYFKLNVLAQKKRNYATCLIMCTEPWMKPMVQDLAHDYPNVRFIIEDYCGVGVVENCPNVTYNLIRKGEARDRMWGSIDCMYLFGYDETNLNEWMPAMLSGVVAVPDTDALVQFISHEYDGSKASLIRLETFENAKNLLDRLQGV